MELETNPIGEGVPINQLVTEALGGQELPKTDHFYVFNAYRNIRVVELVKVKEGKAALLDGIDPEFVASNEFGQRGDELISFEVVNGAVHCVYKERGMGISDGMSSATVNDMLGTRENFKTFKNAIQDLHFQDEWALDFSRYLRLTYAGIRGYGVNEWVENMQRGDGVCFDFSIYKYLIYKHHPRLSENVHDLRLIMYRDNNRKNLNTHYGLSYFNDKGDLILVPGGGGEINLQGIKDIDVNLIDDKRQAARAINQFIRMAEVAKDLYGVDKTESIESLINELVVYKKELKMSQSMEV